MRYCGRSPQRSRAGCTNTATTLNSASRRRREPPAKIVIAELNNQDGLEMIEAMDALNRADVVIVQHEYGIYDGSDGDSIVAVLEGIERPTIVVAHTVLEHPTPTNASCSKPSFARPMQSW